MTSTEFTIGLNGSRVSSKVLRPPGGGSSDIFGLGARQNAPSNGTEDKQNGKTSNTQNRLFGEHTDTCTPSKTHGRSNVLARENTAAATKSTKKAYVRRNPITGEEIVMNQEVSETDTKDDKETDDKETNDNNQENGNEVTKIEIPVKTVQTSIRVRNPPGGKSSGIF